MLNTMYSIKYCYLSISISLLYVQQRNLFSFQIQYVLKNQSLLSKLTSSVLRSTVLLPCEIYAFETILSKFLSRIVPGINGDHWSCNIMLFLYLYFIILVIRSKITMHRWCTEANAFLNSCNMVYLIFVQTLLKNIYHQL